MSSPDEEIRPENYGQKLIYSFLCEKNGITPEDRDFFDNRLEKSALADQIRSATTRATASSATLAATVKEPETEL